MKKILSLVLVLVLALGSFSFATPSDVVGTDSATAVDRLMSLDLLTGYPDGTFKPAATITRAEFAAVVVRSLGLGTAASVNSATKFSDVPATHWASGYISVASGLGIINGYTTGAFGPADPVTYEQAVAMMVRALGYEPQVAKKGGYPAGYLIVASELDLLDGVAGTIGAPAPRGLVAMLVNNALEAKLMEQVIYGDKVEYAVVDKTLLSSKLGLKEIKEQFVTSVDSKFTEFEIAGKVLKAAPGVNVAGLDDLQVTVWYKESTKTAYVVDVHSTVYYDYVEVNTNDVITLWNAAKDIKVHKTSGGAIDATITKDGNALVLDKTGNDGDGNASKYYGKFILDKDGKVTTAQMYTNINAQGIIKSVTDTQLKYTKFDASVVTISKMDDADYKLVVVDGKAAKYSDLKADMYVEYTKLDDEYIIIANSNKVAGTLKSLRADKLKVTIDDKVISTSNNYYGEGVAYYSEDAMESMSAIASSTALENLEGAAVVAYKDNYGTVWLVTGKVNANSTSFYGFVKSANTFNNQVKIVREVEGAIKTVTYVYDFASDSNIKAANLTAYATNDFGTQGSATAVGNPGNEDFFKIYINKDNEITKIMTVTNIQKTVDPLEVSKTNNTFLTTDVTRFYGGDSVKIFDIVQQTVNSVTETGVVRLVKWDTFENASLAGVSFIADTTTPKYMVINGGGIGSSTDYILAYAPSAPTLAAGKYTATVKLAAGDTLITVDDSDVNNWSNSRRVLVLTKNGTEYEVVQSVRNNADGGFATTGSLASIGAIGDYDDVYGTVTVVDGTKLRIGAVDYKVATDAIIYLQSDATTYAVADLSFVEANDYCSVIVEDGIVKVMFFTDADAQ